MQNKKHDPLLNLRCTTCNQMSNLVERFADEFRKKSIPPAVFWS